MTCGQIDQLCCLCETGWSGGLILLSPSAYDGEGRLSEELRTGKRSYQPHIRLCDGCLARVLGRKEGVDA